jgi:hypothetical protein
MRVLAAYAVAQWCIDRQLIVSNEDAFAYPQAQIGFPVPEGFFLPAVAQANN